MMMFLISSIIPNDFQIFFLFIKFYLLNYLLIIYLFIKTLNRWYKIILYVYMRAIVFEKRI